MSCINTGKLGVFKKLLPELVSSIQECNELEDGGGSQKLVRLCGLLKTQLANTESLCLCLEHEQVNLHVQPERGPLCVECKFPVLMVERRLVELRKFHKKVVSNKPAKHLCTSGIFTTLESMVTSKVLLPEKTPGVPRCSECGQISDGTVFHCQLLLGVEDIILNLAQTATNKDCSHSVSCCSCLGYLRQRIHQELMRFQRSAVPRHDPTLPKPEAADKDQEKTSSKLVKKPVPGWVWAIRKRKAQLERESKLEVGDKSNQEFCTFDTPPPKPSRRQANFEPNFFQEVKSFQEMGLKPELVENLIGCGYVKPTTVQQKLIKPCIEGQNIIVQAPPNCGKSMAYLVSVLERVDTSKTEIQVVILAPNPIFAEERKSQLDDLSKKCNISLALFAHEMSNEDVTSLLETKPQIVIGVYSTILSIFKENGLGETVKMLVLDCGHGNFFKTKDFGNKIHQSVTELFPNKLQFVLVKNNMDPRTVEFGEKVMKDPIKIVVLPNFRSIKTFKHYFEEVDENEYKKEKLIEILQWLGDQKVLVFCDSQRKVNPICDLLKDHNFTAFPLNNNETAKRQQKVVNLLSSDYQIVVSVNSLDKHVQTHHQVVINYGVPSKDNYLKRSAHAGNADSVFTITIYKGCKERQLLHEISSHFDILISEIPKNIDRVETGLGINLTSNSTVL